jgi:hypothetical protein
LDKSGRKYYECFKSAVAGIDSSAYQRNREKGRGIDQPVYFVSSIRENFCVDDGRLPEEQSQKGEKSRFQKNIG